MNKDTKLSDLVKGKKVLLVGNSKTLLEEGKADLIDSFEFVIRFNLSIAYMSAYSIGTKCDAWVFAMCRDNVIRKTYKEAKIKPRVCVRYGDPFDIGEANIKLDINKDDVRSEIGIDTNMHPSTGIVTLYYLLTKARCNTISLIGFDSFENHNFYSKSNNAHLCHSQDAERRYLSELVESRKITLLHG